MNHAAPPPAGWYPDPAGRAPFRWWDGSQWTEHTQQGTAPAAITSPPAQPVATAQHLSPVHAASPSPPMAGGPGAPVAPSAPSTPTGGLDAQTFVAELKRFDGWAVVVVGFLLLLLCSFLPWSGGDVSGAGGSEELSANAWSGDSPWLMRGFDVTEDNVLTSAQGGTVESGTDMLILFPLALGAVGVAVAVRVGKRFQRSAEIGLALAVLLAILLVVEAIHVSGALDDFNGILATYGARADFGLQAGFFGGVLAAIVMAVGAGRTYLASKQPAR